MRSRKTGPADTRPPAGSSLTRPGVTIRGVVSNVSRVSDWAYERFGEYLDAAMKIESIRSDAELSRLSGVRHNQLTQWRKGRNRPTTPLLDKLAAALNVPAANLYALAGYVPGIEPEIADTTVVPPEFRELIEFYNDPDLTDEDRRMLRLQARVAVEGVRALVEERSGAGPPTRRTRSAARPTSRSA